MELVPPSARYGVMTLPPSPKLTEAELEAVAGANLWNETFGMNYPG